MKKICKLAILFLLLLITLWSIVYLYPAYRKKAFVNDFSQRVENIQKEDIKELKLEIYYTDPYVFTRHPWSLEDLICCCDEKRIVEGDKLEEFIKKLSKIDSDSLSLVSERTYPNARIAYVLKNQKKEKLLEVILWAWGTEKDDFVYVNGIPIQEERFFYNLIEDYIPENRYSTQRHKY
ncbi:MAG: hypothetical protein E7411_05555 [Ruminococcaceae bacterium]|nr:hypothetical protein [Oscillospiraceae bacterium]